MGDRKTQTLKGFLIPDQRLSFANLDATLSSYTQSGARPGTAVGTDSKSRVLPVVTGEQSVDLEIRTGRAGYPGTEAPKAGGFLKRADGATDWEGWNPWSVVARAGKIRNSTTSGEVSDVCSYRYGPFSGRKVVASTSVYDNTSGARTATYDHESSSYHWTDNGLVYSNGSAPIWDQSITQLPDGRLIMLIASEDPTSAVTTWTMWFSEDDGAAWALYDSDPFNLNGNLPDTLATDNSFAIDRNTKSKIRALPDGSVVFVRFQERTTAGTSNQYTQWASPGLGSAFVEVDSWTIASAGTSDFYDFDVAVTDGGRVVFVRGQTGGTTDSLDAAIVGGAFQSIGDVTVTNLGTRGVSRLACEVAHNGTIAVMATVTNGSMYRYESFDDGANWSDMSSYSADAYDGLFPILGGTTGFKVIGASLGRVGGGLCLVYACEDGSATVQRDDEPYYLILGGWSSVEYEVGDNVGLTDKRASTTWVGVGYPGGTTDWTKAGGGTESIGTDGKNTLTTSSSAIYYVGTANTAASDGLFMGQLEVVSGGSLTTTVIGANVFANDGGTDNWGISICASTTGYGVIDTYAATSLVAVSRTTSAQFQVLVWVSGVDGSYLVADRDLGATAWTVRSTGTATGQGFGGNTYNVWGNPTTGTGVSDWTLVQSVYTRTAPSVGSLEPRSSATASPLLRGAPMSGKPIPLTGAGSTDGGSYLLTEGGPGRVGEEWSIAREYDYPARAMFSEVSPSPSKVWSATNNAANDFVWDLTNDSPLADGSGSVGVYLDGCEFATGSFDGWNGSAWVELVDIDMSGGFLADYTRTGDTLTDNAGAAFDRYLWRGEMDGGYMDSLGVTRAIIKQTEGRWDSALTTKQATIRIEDPTGIGAASSLQAYWPRGLFVAHNVASYDRYRLRIDSNTTPTGKSKIGTVLIGAFVPAGRQWSLSATTSMSPNVNVTRNRFGTSRVTENGPPARSITIQWPDPADLFLHRQSDADPDYLAADAGNPLAAYNDIPYWLQGVFGDVGSGRVPVVLCSNIPNTDASITDRTLFMYGRLMRVGDLTLRLGGEGEKEVIGIGATIIEEIK